LKIENVLLDQKKRNIIKLAGFGASATYKPKGNKKVKNHKYMKDTTGSPYYIAPEVLTAEYDEKCDIWSLGVIMYTLLAGKPPFEGKDEVEIIKNVKTGIYDLTIPELGIVSSEAKALITLLLQFDKDQRISA
jgi:calcium-dependent protein kinase